MPAARLLSAALCCVITAPAAISQISDLTTWDFYRDPNPGPGTLQDAMTGSSAANLAQLNFIDNVDIPAAYDIGFSSVNANTPGTATAGYYFSAAQSFSVTLSFAITLDTPGGVVALGLGIGEDRAGVNSAGIGFGLATLGLTGSAFKAAATTNDSPILKDLADPVSPFLTGSTYAGTLSVAYDAVSGDVTVGAIGSSGSSSATFSGNTELVDWVGSDLLVSFFLRSDSVSTPIAIGPWTGTAAEADFFDFTIVSGSATQVPEPTSLALLGLGVLGLSRRRR